MKLIAQRISPFASHRKLNNNDETDNGFKTVCFYYPLINRAIWKETEHYDKIMIRNIVDEARNVENKWRQQAFCYIRHAVGMCFCF
jgi:hypothetical protein